MDDRVAPRHDPIQQRPVAHVPLDLLQAGMIPHLCEDVVPVEVEVEDLDPVPCLQELRDEDGSHVASPARDENLPNRHLSLPHFKTVVANFKS
ncbi:hypothetical protein D3C86_1724390 [compost metagenome]